MILKISILVDLAVLKTLEQSKNRPTLIFHVRTRDVSMEVSFQCQSCIGPFQTGADGDTDNKENRDQQEVVGPVGIDFHAGFVE